jgi:hypothetical protein
MTVRPLVLCVVATLLALGPSVAGAADTWTTVAPGIEHLFRTTAEPNEIHAVFVDLSRPEIYLRATMEGERKRTTSSFASLVGAKVAINGDLFDYADYYPVGLAVGAGWQWEGCDDPDVWSFIACSVTKECWFDPWGHVEEWNPRWWNVVGGMQDLLVIDGVVQSYGGAFYDKDLHPRTAMGTSQDGKTLILVVVDGRTEIAIGKTLNGMAALMGELGAHNAINVDGGGSSTMVINGQVKNKPSDGWERVVSNHMGIMVNEGGIAPECAAVPNGKYCLDSTRIATCEGGIYLGEGDCGYFGLTCEEEGDFAYCVDPACVNGGQNSFCTSGTWIAGCTDGVYGEGDCGYFGAACVDAFNDAWCAYEFYQGELVDSSFPTAAEDALALAPGGTVAGWFDLLNTGLSTWQPGVTKLAPIPRDEPSPLADGSWLSPTRAATLSAPVPPGEIGRFELTLRGNEVGELTQAFGLVQEAVTWFADPPLGGGPTEDQMVVAVTVACQPDCAGKECGEDGCGGTCGECGDGEGCTDGQCVENAGPDPDPETDVTTPPDSPDATDTPDAPTSPDLPGATDGTSDSAAPDSDAETPAGGIKVPTEGEDTKKSSGCSHSPSPATGPALPLLPALLLLLATVRWTGRQKGKSSSPGSMSS